MDKKYIEKNNLTNAVKRFNQINEYVVSMGVKEADDTQNQPQPNNPEADNQQQQQQGIDPSMEQQQPQMPQQQPQMPQQNNGQDDFNAFGDDGQDAGLDPTIGAESPDAGDEETVDGVEDIEPEMGDDEVIDVDDLTQSQETTEYKIDGVNDKLAQLLDIVSKFEMAIEDNDAKIEDLKSELEKRNPTQQEKLNIRSMNGSPYNVKPEDYWEEQAKNNPNYNIISNNEVDPDKEEDLYTITDDDLRGFNKSEIEKTINDYPKDLKGYF